MGKRKRKEDSSAATHAKRQKVEEELEIEGIEIDREPEKSDDEKENFADSLAYLKTLEEVAGDQKFDDDEDRAIFLENVLEEVKGKEVQFFFNGAASYSIESIVTLATDNQIRELMQKLNGNWVDLCCHRGSSHPIQVMLARVAERMAQGYEETGRELAEDEVPTMQQVVETMCKEFTGNMERFMASSYGSFVLRNIICILSGVKKLEEKHGAKKARGSVKRRWKMQRIKRKVPKLFTSYLVKWAEEIVNIKHFEKLTYKQESVPVLSTLVEALHATGMQDECDQLAMEVMFWKESEDGGERFPDQDSLDFMHDLVVDKSASHLLEKVCQFVSDPVAKKIFHHHFRNELASLSFNKCANYCVQKIVLRQQDEEHIKHIHDELFPKFHELIKRNWGVIWVVVEAASKIKLNYNNIVQKLMNLLKLQDPKNLFRRIIRDKQGNFSAMGCKIFSALLKFRVSELKLIHFGVVDYAAKNIEPLTCDPILSRVFEQAVKAAVQGRQRQKLAKGVLASLDTIVTKEFGSFSVESAFWSANMKNKKKFATELSSRWNQFSGSRFSCRVLDNLRIEQFRKEPKQWESDICKMQSKEKWKQRTEA